MFSFTTFGVITNQEVGRVLFCIRRCGPRSEVLAEAVCCGEMTSNGVSWRVVLAIMDSAGGEER